MIFHPRFFIVYKDCGQHVDNFVTIMYNFVTELQKLTKADILHSHTISCTDNNLCTQFKIPPVNRGACQYIYCVWVYNACMRTQGLYARKILSRMRGGKKST